MPPAAASKRPSRRAAAPVNAPFSWPKSSLSTSVAGSAAMLTATKGAPLRAPCSWMERATSSLPVPLSPVMRTETPDVAARPIAFHTASMRALDPDQRRPLGVPGVGVGGGSGGDGRRLHRAAQRVEELVEIEGLRHVVEGPELHRVDGALAVAVGGGHHHGQRGVGDAQLREELDPVAVLEAHVEQDAVDAAAPEGGARLHHALRRARRHAAGTGDGADQAVADGAVVVDDEDRGHGSPTISRSRG